MEVNELTISFGGNSASIAPDLGAVVTSLKVAGRETLYLDRESLEDPDAPTRGGIPLLYPQAGALEEDLFDQAATTLMKHGFARLEKWRVVDHREDRIRLSLERDENSKLIFPYRFATELTYQMTACGLQAELLIMNMSEAFIPFAPGWHPYFQIPSDKKSEVMGDMDEMPAGALQDEEVFDFGLTPPINGRVEFTIPDLGKMELSFSPDMRWVQFWSLPGRDFICIEPFYGPPNALNRPDQRLEIPPHGARTLFMRIEFHDIQRSLI